MPRVPTPEIPLIINNSTEDLPKVDENTELPEKLLAKDHNIELSSEENETKTSSQENSSLILDKTKLEAKNVSSDIELQQRKQENNAQQARLLKKH